MSGCGSLTEPTTLLPHVPENNQRVKPQCCQKSLGNTPLDCEIKGPLSPEHALIHGAVCEEPLSRAMLFKGNRKIRALDPASRANGL